MAIVSDIENAEVINDVVEENDKSEPEINVLEVDKTEKITTRQVFKKINLSKNNLIMSVTLSVIALLIVSSIVVYRVYFDMSNIKPVVNNTITTPDVEEEPVADDNKVEDIVIEPVDKALEVDMTISQTDKEVWLAKSIDLTDQDYFAYTDGPEVEYRQIGVRGGNKIIMTTTYGIGEHNVLFEQKADGSVTLICFPSSITDYDNSELEHCSSSVTYASKLKYTANVHYDSLSYLDNYILDSTNSTVYVDNSYSSIGDTYYAPASGVIDTKVRQIGDSAIYKRESTNVITNLKSIEYYIKTPINTKIRLSYYPLDLVLSKYQWLSGATSVDSNLKPITRGCGTYFTSATQGNSIVDGDVQKVGVSGNNLAVYEFKDANNILVKKAYEEYVDFYKNMGSSVETISLSEFIKQHALVLYKDVYGQWLVYVRESLAPIGGCAKPVIYLYPTKEQQISVKVGADVKISDPYYNPKTGWNVIAKPDGQIINNGNTYSSLFWEGKGYGIYPEITNGTVVEKKDALATIRNQLYEQGLKSNEINDFIGYWQYKLPDNPYVRLTWFDTAQIDKLAPLNVSPKPDTSIRVFLDMEGLDGYINIPAQNLTSIDRKGYTLIEWGGLSESKLY